LKPHYDASEFITIKKRVADGETAFIDPRFQERSFGDARLAEIIPLCWKKNPNERIDVFGLVDLLRTAVQTNGLLIELAQM
jgi:hypothetical protein